MLIINKDSIKIDILDKIHIDIGIRQLISLNTKKEYMRIIKEKANEHKDIKEILFAVQNEDVIIREYSQLPKIRKKDLAGYINFEIAEGLPVNLDDYIIKYKVLNLDKSTMDLQVILFPKYIEKICADIASDLNIKRKYLNMNFDIVQKLIDKNRINLTDGNCIIIEDMGDSIILNLVKQKKIYTSNIFEKEGSMDYVFGFLEEDMHIFYYGYEDNFIEKMKEQGFKVDNLEINLKIKDLSEEKTVDNNINKYVISVGVVV